MTLFCWGLQQLETEPWLPLKESNPQFPIQLKKKKKKVQIPQTRGKKWYPGLFVFKED